MEICGWVFCGEGAIRFEDIRSGMVCCGRCGRGADALRMREGCFRTPGGGTAGNGLVAYVLIACGGGKFVGDVGNDGGLEVGS